MIDPVNSPAGVVTRFVEQLEQPVLDLEALRSMTTHVAAVIWHDFRMLAYNWSTLDRPGWSLQEQSEPDSFDVVYVPIISGVNESFTVPASGAELPVIGVFTLVFSTARDRWLVHAFTEYSQRPRPEVVPRD